MLTSAAGIDSLIEALEVRFLANRDPNLHFALLTDFFDAGQETQPEDAALMQLAAEKIDDLNFKFGQNFRLTVGEAAQPPAGSIFSCSTGRAAGIRRNACGWATNASAASWPTSMPCS
jgi:hypothetical protein